MPFVSSKGARIHYSVFDGRPEGRANGAGRPIVLLQGLGLSSRFWFDIPAALASDPEGARRVITIDNRGTGKSEAGPRRFWTMATMADDVAAVLDAENVAEAIVVGISMGGMIAQNVALRHPDRVKGLLLLATTPGFFFGALPEVRAMARLLSLPFGGKRASRNLVRLLLPESKWERARDIFKDWPRAMRDDPTTAATFLAHLFASSTHLTGLRLKQIRCKTIIVAGELDSLIPPANARALARGIPAAELEIIPDTGHAVFAEDRDLVRRMVERLERG
jgi:3-oxoadipate enol-lactonase